MRFALAALARTERAVLGNIHTVEANSVARHTELKAELASRGEAARPPDPSPRDDEAKRKAAAERALGGQFVIRERRDAVTHPALFTVARYIFDGGLRVDVHADDSCCVWVGSFLAVRKRAGWSPSDLAEVADRAVTAVARVRRTNRRVAPALRAVG